MNSFSRTDIWFGVNSVLKVGGVTLYLSNLMQYIIDFFNLHLKVWLKILICNARTVVIYLNEMSLIIWLFEKVPNILH